jgi:hypothetical protein
MTTLVVRYCSKSKPKELKHNSLPLLYFLQLQVHYGILYQAGGVLYSQSCHPRYTLINLRYIHIHI